MQAIRSYFSGEGKGEVWHVVASRVTLGAGAFASPQWYLSVYSWGGPAPLVYRSPGDSEHLLTRLEKVGGAPHYFPLQSLRIVGNAKLLHNSAWQAVVMVHETGADCGAATVAVIGIKSYPARAMSAPGHLSAGPLVTVNNACSLSARIVGRAEGGGQVLELTGPYYAKNAPLYKPTKNRATAILRYDGEWTETPRYFTLRTPAGS